MVIQVTRHKMLWVEKCYATLIIHNYFIGKICILKLLYNPHVAEDNWALI